MQNRRIVSLLSSATEMLCLLALDDQLLAISHECDFPAGIVHKPRVTCSNIESTLASQAIDDQVRQQMAAGQPLYSLDIQQLCELRPDLIVTQAQCDVCAIRYEDVLQAVREQPALAATQVLALNPTSLQEVLADITRLGVATGREAVAASVVRQLNQRVERVRARTEKLPPTELPRVACIEWTAPLMLAGNWMPDLIAWAGGQQPCQPGEHSRYWTWDALRAFDPEVIVIMPCGFDLQRSLQEARPLTELPGWNGVSAVRAGRVFVADGNAYFNRSGPRLVDSLEMLTALVQPALWKDSFAARPWHDAWRVLN